MYKRLIPGIIMLYVILGCWKGHIALYKPNQPEPWQIFPNRVTSLPAADQEALEKGIIVRNERDLHQLLEDYLS